MKIKINGSQLNLLASRQRLHTFLSKSFTRLYFKVTSDKLYIYMRGANGVAQTSVDIENLDNFIDEKYLSLDYLKWITALQKFFCTKGMILTFTSNSVKICGVDSENDISIGIVSYKEDSSEASVINNFLPTKKQEIMKAGAHLVLDDEIMNGFDMTNTLFVVQSEINSIGLTPKSVMYADRSVVLKINLSYELDKSLFQYTDDGNLYIVSSLISLFKLIYNHDPNVYFSADDNPIIYWADSNTEIVYASEDRKISLPSEDEWNEIKPSSEDAYFEAPVASISDSLDFFIGFYENSMWKPLVFDADKKAGVVLKYHSPSVKINKDLLGATCTANSSFQIDSETLGKITSKITASEGEGSVLRFTYDEEAPGIYCTSGTKYEAVLSKLDSGE